MLGLKALLSRYFLFTGGVVHILLITIWLLIPFVFGQPSVFLIERISNLLVQSSSPYYQKIGRILLSTPLVNDWQHPDLTNFSPQPLSNWQGQGASYQRSVPDVGRTYYVANEQQFFKALKKVRPGENILLFKGVYQFSQRSIRIHTPGQINAPITVKSSQLGLVKIKLNTLEGFHIEAPYWHFENLDIQGVCLEDDYCEHAFHIVGRGQGFQLKNSIIHDFNAAIKVNGVGNDFPDRGVLENNTFYNSRARTTSSPVTLVNIDSVNNWLVRGNLIADFVKAGGDHISYGSFMKGNGRGGIYENNLIICEMNLPPDQGIRIGLSLGGGGTGQQYCRQKNCETEFTDGIIRNNIILNCSHDVGIYLNKAAKSKIYNNLLFNNLGIDVRFQSSQAEIYNNLISGRIKARHQGRFSASHNIIDPYCISTTRHFDNCQMNQWFWDLTHADLGLKEGDAILQQGKYIKTVTTDFCGQPRHIPFDIGPIQYSNTSICNPIDRSNDDSL